MSEYVWRTSSKAFRSLRNPCIDRCSSSDINFVLSLNKGWRFYSRKGKKSRQNDRADKSVWNHSEQNDNSFGVVMQQDAQRPKAVEEKRMNLFSKLKNYFSSHSQSKQILKEAEEKAKDINRKLDHMIATLDGEADWFVECHTTMVGEDRQ